MKRPGVRRWISLPWHNRAVRERDVDDEIALHIALRADRLVQQGHPRDQALLEADRRFGGTRARDTLRHQVQSQERTMSTREWSADAAADLRFTLRQLLRVPVFTVTAVATIALGVGANVTMFGAVDRLLLQPPAHVRSPDRVMLPSVTFSGQHGTNTQRVLSFPIFLDMASDSAFTAVASFAYASLTHGSGSATRELNGLRVTPAYFAVLGTRPVMGRFFDNIASPEQPSAHEVVVSEPFWRTVLGGSTSAIGSTIELSGARYEVIGVAPRGFIGTGTRLIDAWIPYAAGATPARIAEWKAGRQWFSLRIVARLRDGIAPAAAAASASLAVQRGELRDGDAPDLVRQRNATVALTSALPRDVRGASAESRVALLLAAMSLFVLVLACANITNLQLGRAIRRYREVSVRVALGVARGRLIRLLLTESIVLSLLGGAAAIAVAWWGTLLMHRTLLSNLQLASTPVDLRMVAYTTVIAVVIGIVTGLFPAVQSSRPDLITSLRTGGQPTGARGRARFLLLLTQSALALVLLIGTGLFARSLQRIESVPLGLDADHVVVASLNTTGRDYDDATLNAMYRTLESAASTTPGVEHVSLTMSLPFGATTAAPVHVPGLDSLPLTPAGGPYVNAVGPDFFFALGTPIVAGRAFTREDREGAAPVVIVNETAARLWWPRETALGKCVRLLEVTAPCATVVGVAANSRRQSIIEDETVQVFAPGSQATIWAVQRTLVARVRGDAAAAAVQVRRALQAVPGLPYVQVAPLSSRVASQTRSWRLGAMMFGAFALLAVTLAAIGLYGVLALDVSQRTREIGVRLALGGAPLGISALVVRQGVTAVGAGCLFGLAAALAAGSQIEPLLFRTSRLDPLVFLTALGAILATAVIASWVPARRAARVDPVSALQSD
jgi:predicted permease